jgi:hypothetical protein
MTAIAAIENTYSLTHRNKDEADFTNNASDKSLHVFKFVITVPVQNVIPFVLNLLKSGNRTPLQHCSAESFEIHNIGTDIRHQS